MSFRDWLRASPEPVWVVKEPAKYLPPINFEVKRDELPVDVQVMIAHTRHNGLSFQARDFFFDNHSVEVWYFTSVDGVKYTMIDVSFCDTTDDTYYFEGHLDIDQASLWARYN